MAKGIGALALGVVMLIVGAALTLTVVGAIVGVPLALASGVPLARVVIGRDERTDALASDDLSRWTLVRDGSGVAALLRAGEPIADFGDPDRASRAVVRRAAVVVSRETGKPATAHRIGSDRWGFREN